MNQWDQRLFEFYLALGGAEAGPWNRSPRCLYIDHWTRNFIVEDAEPFLGIRVCNVGIGVGEWDNFLCDWLNGKGRLTSIDIDSDICRRFAYRQHREGHPNPTTLVCADILTDPLPAESFDLITTIGSTAAESGEYDRFLTACWRMVRTGGRMLFMDFFRHPPERFVAWAASHDATILTRLGDDIAEGYIFWLARG